MGTDSAHAFAKQAQRAVHRWSILAAGLIVSGIASFLVLQRLGFPWAAACEFAGYGSACVCGAAVFWRASRNQPGMRRRPADLLFVISLTLMGTCCWGIVAMVVLHPDGSGVALWEGMLLVAPGAVGVLLLAGAMLWASRVVPQP